MGLLMCKNLVGAVYKPRGENLGYFFTPPSFGDTFTKKQLLSDLVFDEPLPSLCPRGQYMALVAYFSMQTRQTEALEVILSEGSPNNRHRSNTIHSMLYYKNTFWKKYIYFFYFFLENIVFNGEELNNL